MKKNEIELNSEHTVDFIKNAKGGKPICRIDGIIGFITMDEKTFVAPCSRWIVRVIEVRETSVVVLPLLKTHTAKECIVEVDEKINQLRAIKVVSKEKKAPIKKNYQYKSFQELKV